MIGTIVFGAFSLLMLALAWASLIGRHHPACKPEDVKEGC